MGLSNARWGYFSEMLELLCLLSGELDKLLNYNEKKKRLRRLVDTIVGIIRGLNAIEGGDEVTRKKVKVGSLV